MALKTICLVSHSVPTFDLERNINVPVTSLKLLTPSKFIWDQYFVTSMIIQIHIRLTVSSHGSSAFLLLKFFICYIIQVSSAFLPIYYILRTNYVMQLQCFLFFARINYVYSILSFMPYWKSH